MLHGNVFKYLKICDRADYIRLTFVNFLILKKARSPNLLSVILPLLQLSFITSTFPSNLKLSNPNQSPPTIQTHLQPHPRVLQATRDKSM